MQHALEIRELSFVAQDTPTEQEKPTALRLVSTSQCFRESALNTAFKEVTDFVSLLHLYFSKTFG